MRYLEGRKRYQYRISYKDQQGKSHRKSFYGEKAADARKQAKEWLEFYEKTNKSSDINPAIDHWIHTWLMIYMKDAVRPSTLDKYACCLKPVMSAFKGVRLNQLEVSELQQFFQQQLFSGGRKEQGLSPITVRNQRRYLSSCIDMAVRLGLTNRNPVKLTTPPRVEKAENNPLSELEVKALLRVAKSNVEEARNSDNIGRLISEEELYIGVMIAVYTGMRLGEIMALKWSDFNITTAFLSVQRSKSDVKGQNITNTKTGHGRKIQIGIELVDALKEHKRLQGEYKKILGSAYEDQNWIIGGLFGKGYNKRHYSSRKFQKLLKEVNIIRHIRFHDLRHTHATLLMLAGVNPKIVQERLGHSSIDVTLDTYSHLTLANQSIAVDALERVIAKKAE